MAPSCTRRVSGATDTLGNTTHVLDPTLAHASSDGAVRMSCGTLRERCASKNGGSPTADGATHRAAFLDAADGCARPFAFRFVRTAAGDASRKDCARPGIFKAASI